MPNRYPIIYIRGFAFNESERDKTTADPFCGFNNGSTVYRAVENKYDHPDKFIFESPIIRLSSEYQYQHVYRDGLDITDPNWENRKDEKGRSIGGIPPASVIIYRYYDDASSFFGHAPAHNITEYAAGLNSLILQVKKLVRQYQADSGTPLDDEDFRCYLVAHSMGGLVARALLQNPQPQFRQAQQAVAKLFTFATPHNGIELLGRNIPDWLTLDQANTFNRSNMMQYLHLQQLSPHFDQRVDLIPASALPADRIFCMVGTNRGDFEPLQGMLRSFVGHGSDGLVLIDNASLWGVSADNQPQQVATAYAFRSHAGYFGLVNSEEAYQNLVRFLFGDVRVDIWADIDSVSLPASIQQQPQVSGLYQFEFCAAPRGKRWQLTRRTSVEDSPACRSHQQLTGGNARDKQVYLSTLFLCKRGKVDQSVNTLSYAMTFSVNVPDYKIGNRFWADDHFEGASLFHDMAVIQIAPPLAADGTGNWTVTFGWSDNPQQHQQTLQFQSPQTSLAVNLPFASAGTPGICGKIRLQVSPWS